MAQAIAVPNYIINSLIACRGGAEHRAGTHAASASIKP